MIYTDGRVETDYAQWSVDKLGRVEIGTAYQERLAAMLPGGSVRRTPKMAGWRVVMSGQSRQLGVLLDHQAGWINVVEQFVDDIRQAFFEGAQA